MVGPFQSSAFLLWHLYSIHNVLCSHLSTSETQSKDIFQDFPSPGLVRHFPLRQEGYRKAFSMVYRRQNIYRHFWRRNLTGKTKHTQCKKVNTKCDIYMQRLVDHLWGKDRTSRDSHHVYPCWCDFKTRCFRVCWMRNSCLATTRSRLPSGH